MNEMLNYMFRSLKTTETALERVSKTLRKQNRRIRLLVLAGGAYVAWSEMNRREQEEKLDNLKREIKELRGEKE